MENLQEEIWLPIPEYEGLYEVSSWGRVKSIARLGTKGGIMKGYIRGGYCRVGLTKDAKRIEVGSHQLVCIAFLGHKRCGMELVIDHINGVKTDNRVENLRIVTQRENMSIGFKKENANRFSKLRGVYKHRNKLRSAMQINGRYVSLGVFNDEQSAHSFYICANENLDRYKNDIQFQKEIRKILNYEDGRIFDHEHIWYCKERGDWCSSVSINRKKIFTRRCKSKENAILLSIIATQNKNLFSGDKIEFKNMVLEIFNKQKEGV